MGHGRKMSFLERSESAERNKNKPCLFARDTPKMYDCLTCGKRTYDVLAKAEKCKFKKP